MIERDSTVLPEPDSPTMPRVCPRSTVNETPSVVGQRPLAPSRTWFGGPRRRAAAPRGGAGDVLVGPTDPVIPSTD